MILFKIERFDKIFLRKLWRKSTLFLLFSKKSAPTFFTTNHTNYTNDYNLRMAARCSTNYTNVSEWPLVQKLISGKISFNHF